MIIGSVSVYKCDGLNCEAIKVVPVEQELEFEKLWHSGMTSHFCPDCKAKFENAAAVLKDENAMAKLTSGVTQEVRRAA